MQALNRLISILDLVAERHDRVAAVEVAQEMDLPLSTTARLLRDLADEDLLYRSSLDGRYGLGPRIYSLAVASANREDLADLARSELAKLRDETTETASMHVLRGSHRVCIAEVQSRLAVRRVVPPGLIQEMCGSATGEVLLAHARDGEVSAAADRAGLDKSGRAQLESRLKKIRSEGYAISHDRQRTVRGVSAPLWRGEEVVAAVSVSGPSDRFTAARAKQTASLLLDSVERLRDKS